MTTDELKELARMEVMKLTEDECAEILSSIQHRCGSESLLSLFE